MIAHTPLLGITLSILQVMNQFGTEHWQTFLKLNAMPCRLLKTTYGDSHEYLLLELERIFEGWNVSVSSSPLSMKYRTSNQMKDSEILSINEEKQ